MTTLYLSSGAELRIGLNEDDVEELLAEARKRRRLFVRVELLERVAGVSDTILVDPRHIVAIHSDEAPVEDEAAAP